MSYDIHLFLPKPGEDPLVTAQRDEEDFDRPLSAEAKARNAKAVAALRSLRPSLDVSEGDRFVQLQPDGETGIVIELNDTSGSIAIPYWHEKNAEQVLGAAGGYLRALHGVGFAAYDRQTGRLVHPGEGLGPSAASVYAVGVNALKGAARKPWWKFWG
jgi:hypothetical protein